MLTHTQQVAGSANVVLPKNEDDSASFSEFPEVHGTCVALTAAPRLPYKVGKSWHSGMAS